MGISLRALRKLDADGILKADIKDGRRRYTSEHLLKALELMGGGQSKTIKITFCKNGASSMFGKAPLPKKWLNVIGITQDEPEAELNYDGEKLIIRKMKADQSDSA